MKYHKQEQLYIEGEAKRRSCYPTVLACIMDIELNEIPDFSRLYFEASELDLMNKVFQSQWTDKDEEWRRNYYINNYSIAKNLWDMVRKFWLASKGYYESHIESIDDWLSNNKDVPYVVRGVSARGIGHVVVYVNGEMIHDPHPSNAGLVEIDKEYAYRTLIKYNERQDQA
jgi:hypothetical protein